jgi:hypothetical protein
VRSNQCCGGTSFWCSAGSGTENDAVPAPAPTPFVWLILCKIENTHFDKVTAPALARQMMRLLAAPLWNTGSNLHNYMYKTQSVAEMLLCRPTVPAFYLFFRFFFNTELTYKMEFRYWDSSVQPFLVKINQHFISFFLYLYLFISRKLFNLT